MYLQLVNGIWYITLTVLTGQNNINVPNHTVDPLALFWGVWTDGKEVFISDTENGIIYHGR